MELQRRSIAGTKTQLATGIQVTNDPTRYCKFSFNTRHHGLISPLRLCLQPYSVVCFLPEILLRNLLGSHVGLECITLKAQERNSQSLTKELENNKHLNPVPVYPLLQQLPASISKTWLYVVMGHYWKPGLDCISEEQYVSRVSVISSADQRTL